MALTFTAGTPKSGQIPGFGNFVIGTIAWDNAYAKTAHERVDLSTISPLGVPHGAFLIATATGTHVFKCVYVKGASAASGWFEAYKATGVSGVDAEVASGVDLSAMTGQVWCFAVP